MPTDNPTPTFRTKICGVRRSEDLELLAMAGVDAVGFNFVAHSQRYLAPQLANELSIRAADLGLVRVAVVMDPSQQDLDELLSKVQVDWVQFHGHESPSIVSVCHGLPILKATSWSGRAEERELVTAWRPEAETGHLAAWLIDAYAPVAGGGTGQTASWELLVPRPAIFGKLPLILAGGLNPNNVAEAILASGADGVDTASGVELAPGIKSAELVTRFAQRTQGLWQRPP